MTVRFAVEEQAAAVILAYRPGKKVGESIKAEVGHLVLTVLNIQLHVVEDASERPRMTAMDPMKGRRAFMLILKDSSVGEVRGGPDAHQVTVGRRHEHAPT